MRKNTAFHSNSFRILNHYMASRAVLLMFFVCVLGLVACGNDTQAPSILVQTPKDQDRVQTGTNLAFSAQFSDNDALRQYKLDIHPNFDGHSHGKPAAMLPAWDTIIVGNLNGAAQSINFSLYVPNQTRTGEYHLTVFALDLAGNEGRYTRIIHLFDAQDTLAPEIQISAPQNGATFQQQLAVEANIQDFQSNGSIGSIGSISLRLVREDAPTQVLALGTFLESNNFAGAYDSATGIFSKVFAISGIGSGSYILYFIAIDQTGNQTQVQLNLVKS